MSDVQTQKTITLRWRVPGAIALESESQTVWFGLDIEHLAQFIEAAKELLAHLERLEIEE